MKTKFILSLLGIILCISSYAQYGINTTSPHPSSILEIHSDSTGILIPQLTKLQKDHISPLTEGLLIFQVDENEGFYYYSNSNWKKLNIKPSLDNLTDCKSDPDDGSSIFIGINNGQNDNGYSNANTVVGALSFADNQSGKYNTGCGYSTLISNTEGNNNTSLGIYTLTNIQSGHNNIAVGYQSGINALNDDNISFGRQALFNSPGSFNIAVGHQCLQNNSSGYGNIAFGWRCLEDHTTGDYNIAFGKDALRNNLNNNFNIALGGSMKNYNGQFQISIGYNVLNENTSGYKNIGIGNSSLTINETGQSNIGIGTFALNQNLAGVRNIAIGRYALSNNINHDNIGIGHRSLEKNEGSGNIGLGANTIYENTCTSVNNIGIGVETINKLSSGEQNLAIGYRSLFNNQSGNDNIGIGIYALEETTSGSNNVVIGTSARENLSGHKNTILGQNNVQFYTAQSSNTIIGTNNISNANPHLGSTLTILGNNIALAINNVQNILAIGNNVNAFQENKIYLGNSSITDISGQVPFTTYSDMRIKADVQEDIFGLEFIESLRPVSYSINTEKQNLMFQNSGIKSSSDISTPEVRNGFLAQEVENAMHELGYSFSGLKSPSSDDELYQISYAEFVVPLVKAVQEQQKELKDFQHKICEAQTLLVTLKNLIKDNTSTSHE